MQNLFMNKKMQKTKLKINKKQTHNQFTWKKKI